MKTYFRQSGALGLPTVLVISLTAQNALDYAAVHSLEWCLPEDRVIETTVDIEKEKTVWNCLDCFPRLCRCASREKCA